MPRKKMSPQARGAITRKRNREYREASLAAAVNGQRFAVPAIPVPGGGTSHLLLEKDKREAGEPVQVMLSWPEHDAVMLMREIDSLDEQLRAKRQQLAELVADKTS